MSDRAWRIEDDPRRLPVMRPLLPTQDQLQPYLREIDDRRVYANRGPLLARFEAQLAEHFGVDVDRVVVTASGTAGLAAVLMAVAGEGGGRCVVPGWTFVGTGNAIVMAGLEPWIVDVDPATQALDPDTVADLLAERAAPVGAVLVVQPFGAPVDLAGWQRFQADTGVPVVVDAAAGFDTVATPGLSVVVSMHATKVLGVGEGGVVIAAPDIAHDVRRRIDFGFDGTREALVRALNGKLSEYSAAVGLAALAAWPSTREDYLRVARTYADGFAGTRVQMLEGYGRTWVSSTAVLTVPTGTLETVEDRLAADSIATRRWWGDGLAAHQAFRDCLRVPLSVTEQLAASSIGVPCWADLPDDEVRRVVELVLSCIS